MIVQRLRVILSAQALRVYLFSVALAGAFVLVDAAIEAVRAPHPLQWLALAGLGLVARSFRLNFASGSANIAAEEDTFYIATALLFGGGPATLGIAAGVAVAFGVARLVGSLLFGIQPHDPMSYAVAAALLLTTAACAALIPALRAARIDPIVTLKDD